MSKSSWDHVSAWYDKTVGKEGHYYHRHIVLPHTLALLDLKNAQTPSVLDLGCGQGVLARALPKEIPYLGIDVSPSLIAAATHEAPPKCSFIEHDLQTPLDLPQKDFSHATILLALQNMQQPEIVIRSAADHLRPQGTLIIVLNHPCFRIPRQSSWGIDEQKKLQYRRMDRYHTPLEIPITMHPSKGPAIQTVSYHYPLERYLHALKMGGFCLTDLEEWCSDKVSSGTKGKMENRARKEFPLFLALCCEKR